jgi:hypothetical protein
MKKIFKREWMEWAVLLEIPVALYFSGLPTEVLGGVQPTGWQTSKPFGLPRQSRVPEPLGYLVPALRSQTAGYSAPV